LFLNPPARYSEDLDFVRKNPISIGPLINAIRDALKSWLGEPNRKITERGFRLTYKYQSISNLPAKLKIEVNTTEYFQALPTRYEKFFVDSDWYKGGCEIATYEIDELIATKLRALYQRRKGRDLFDLWYVSKQNLVDLKKMVGIFQKYCAAENICISKKLFCKNLELKRKNRDFCIDMDALLPGNINWNFEEAYDFVKNKIINRLP